MGSSNQYDHLIKLLLIGDSGASSRGRDSFFTPRRLPRSRFLASRGCPEEETSWQTPSLGGQPNRVATRSSHPHLG